MLLVAIVALCRWTPHALWPGVLLLAFVLWFFRDPARPISPDPRNVVSPADGVVADIGLEMENQVLKTEALRIGIFLSVLDVHVNRAPIAGEVVFSRAQNGKYLDARHPKASALNAFRTWAFRDGDLTIVVRQITGAIARRIVAWANVGDSLKKGDHFGMIRFGSRTEIFLPPNTELMVKKGDRVLGGETVVARLPAPTQ